MIFPRRCPFCGRLLPLGETVCRGCFRGIPRAGKPLELDSDGERLTCYVPYAYEKQVRKAILELKYHRRADHALFFAQAVADLLKGQKFDAVVCVPDDLNRHPAQEKIARELAKIIGAPLIFPLYRDRGTRRQHDLTEAERLTNVRNAYHRKKQADLSGLSCLLADDIVTTGATLAGCARALSEAGARSVTLCAAAKTVRKKPEPAVADRPAPALRNGNAVQIP